MTFCINRCFVNHLRAFVLFSFLIMGCHDRASALNLSPHDDVINKDDKVCFNLGILHEKFKKGFKGYTGNEYRKLLDDFRHNIPNHKRYDNNGGLATPHSPKKEYYEEKSILSANQDKVKQVHERAENEHGSRDPDVRFLSSMLDSTGEARIWLHFLAYYEANTKLFHGRPLVRNMRYGEPRKLALRLTENKAVNICANFIDEVQKGRPENKPTNTDSPYYIKCRDNLFNSDYPDDEVIVRPFGRAASLLPNGKSNVGFSFKSSSLVARVPACAGGMARTEILKNCRAALRTCKN